MQRSIWISTEDWELIKIAAAVAEKTLSRYLLNLHKMNITSRGIIPPTIPDAHARAIGKSGMEPSPGAVIVDIESPEIPSPASASSGTGGFFHPRPKGQDGIKKK